MNTKEIINEVKESVSAHETWRGSECINLIASENVMSPLAVKLYNSDFRHRYAEGLPHKRYYQGLGYVDDVEERVIALGKKLFGAEFLDVRPISGCNAILTILTAFGK